MVVLELVDRLRRIGFEHYVREPEGMSNANGRTVVVWPVRDNACGPLEFTECDGRLAFSGTLSVEQAVMLATMASLQWR